MLKVLTGFQALVFLKWVFKVWWHLVLMDGVAAPWASPLSTVLDQCWLPGNKKDFPPTLFTGMRKNLRGSTCKRERERFKALLDPARREQVTGECFNAAVLVLETQQGTIFQPSDNNTSAFRHRQSLFVYDHWIHPNIQAGKWDPSPQNMHSVTDSAWWTTSNTAGKTVFWTDCFWHGFTHMA